MNNAFFSTKANADATPHLFAVVEKANEAFGDARHALESEADYMGHNSAEDCVDDHAHRIMSVIEREADEQGWDNLTRELGYDAQRWFAACETDVRDELYNFIPDDFDFSDF